MKRRNPSRQRTIVTDGALATALLAVCLLTAPLLGTWVEGQRTVNAAGYGLLILACAPITVRRRFPVAVLAVTAVVVSTYLVAGFPYGPVFAPLAVAVYTVGRHTSTIRAVVAAAVAFLGILPHLVVGPTPTNLLGIAPAAAWVAIPFTIGIARRLVTESQARERAETERRKLDDERLRLATEVHDIVGHGLAAIQMQADIALHIADAKPDQARVALQAISSASATALGELRSTLSAITTDSEQKHKDPAHAPTPGLARVNHLCDRVRAAGAHVELSVTGQPRPVPPDVDIVAYRLVQESLTNVVKHAARRDAQVTIAYNKDTLTVTVTNPHDRAPIKEGFGIRGMRRRVEQLHGQFLIKHGDTLTIRAELPTPQEE